LCFFLRAALRTVRLFIFFNKIRKGETLDSSLRVPFESMAASRPLSCPSSRAKTTVARSSSPAAIARMRTPSPARKAKGFLASSSSPLSSSASSLFVRRRGCSALPPDWVCRLFYPVSREGGRFLYSFSALDRPSGKRLNSRRTEPPLDVPSTRFCFVSAPKKKT
jgi:hypothetical protein